MTFAQIGPLTNALQGAAAAIGAGMLMGGFLIGLAGLVRAWPKSKFDARVLSFGYGGGIVGAAVLIADITFRYGI